MKIIENKIEVSKTGRYYTSSPASSDLKSLWIVIHGYASLARNFIKEFEFLDDEYTMITAPEALSKFYSRNKIGASWMTREDRSNEINDYLSYLDKFFDEIKNNFNITGAEINLLGFSQGVHTAVRWFTHTANHIDKLILCSSDFPKDADFSKLKKKMLTSEMEFIYAGKDDFFSQETFRQSMDLLKKNKINFKEITFDSGHVIDQTSIISYINQGLQ